MKRKTIVRGVMAILLGLLAVSPASANTGSGGIFTASVFFNLVLLGGAVVGLLWALQILDLVKGGLMSKSWQMFLLGFVSLALAQLLVLIQRLNFVAIPDFVSSFFYVIMAGTWLAGLYQTRKVLG